MKTKFYPLRTLLFTLLLSFGIAETIKAQAIHLDLVDMTTGHDGSQTYPGDSLLYTITVTGPITMINPRVACPVPPGTTYIPQTTTLNGSPFADQFGSMPWATAQLIPTPASATDAVTIKFRVRVAANSGFIIGNAVLTTANYLNIPPSTTSTNVLLMNFDCWNQFYSLTTMYPPGYLPLNPSIYYPYQFIRELNVNTGNTGLVYNGKTGNCWNSAGHAPLPAGSVLTDATAMALQSTSWRLYFVNKPVNNMPADLCYYITYPAGSTTAYQIVGSPLTTNTTSLITRMTMDALGNGYAITDDGLEFIHFTADSSSVTVDNRGPLVDDPSNGSNSVLLETGGDIVSDGSGNLIMITFLGKVYRINPSNNVAKYISIIANFPAAGCTAVAIDKDGFLYIGGRYTNYYKLTLSTLTLTSLTTTGSFATSDFAGCAVPIQPARIAVNETTTTSLSAEVSARILPNPFRKQLNLQVQLTTAEIVKIRLVDFYGRTVYTTTRQMGAGTNSLNVAVPGNLSSGIYVVDIWAGNNHLLQKKLVKQ